MYGLIAESSFDAAHFLTGYDGKCENLHGHRWKVTAWVETESLKDSGQEKDMVADFSVLKRALKELTDEFDHMFIVEEGSLYPSTVEALLSETFEMKVVPWRTTSENFAKHFFDRLCDAGFEVSMVEVDETPNNRAYYKKDDERRSLL